MFKILNEEGVWQKLLCNKYLNGKTLAQVQPRPNDFFARGSFMVGNGRHTRFWGDTWLENKPLVVQYPSMFNIARHKNVLVAQVLSSTPLNIEFRRSLIGDKLISWLKQVERQMRVNLSDEDDCFKWNLTMSSLSRLNLCT